MRDRPILIAERSPLSAGPQLVDYFPVAQGARAVVTLAQVMYCRSNVGVWDADEPHHLYFFGYMITILQRISNRVGEYEPGPAHVRLDGLEGVHRSEPGVASALLNPVPSYLNFGIAVRDAKFPALVAAQTCTAIGAFRVLSDGRASLTAYTINPLPVSSDVKSEMDCFGQHTIGLG